MVSDWAGLPKHLLDIILDKLVSFSDYIRFSAVCVSWYGLAIENRKHFGEKIVRQLPLLLLPKKDEEEGELKVLYNVTTKKLMNLEFRVPFSTRYGGSSKGWLIIMGEDYVVSLINPISSETAIRLPPITKDEQYHFIQIHKAILSADPTTEPHDYTVVVIYGDQSQLAFIKPGKQDACWTYVNKLKAVFEDIIYHEGRLHVIDFKGEAFSFDDYDIKEVSVPRALSPFPNLNRRIDSKSYLVQSLGGELLLVHRHISFFINDNIETPLRNTVKFEVYKWDPIGPMWINMESLGGESLFLGDNMSISILAADFPGCSPNSIYFNHDLDDILGFEEHGPSDSGVFNLENSTFAPHYATDQAFIIAMIKQPPIWFVPNFLSAKPFPIEKIAKFQNELQQLKFIPRPLDENPTS